MNGFCKRKTIKHIFKLTSFMKQIFLFSILCSTVFFANAQNWDSLSKEAAKTEIYEPVPKIVTPGTFNITALPMQFICLMEKI